MSFNTGGNWLVKYNKVLRETDKAIRLDFGDDWFAWFPKSQISIQKEYNQITCPEWLIKEKGIEKYVIR